MSWAYAEACANRLANQGFIPIGRPVWVLPQHIDGAEFRFTEHCAKAGFGVRHAAVHCAPLPGGRLYMPHGEGAV